MAEIVSLSEQQERFVAEQMRSGYPQGGIKGVIILSSTGTASISTEGILCVGILVVNDGTTMTATSLPKGAINGGTNDLSNVDANVTYDRGFLPFPCMASTVTVTAGAVWLLVSTYDVTDIPNIGDASSGIQKY